MSLKQSAKDSAAEREHFNGDSSNCWHRERDRPCLRVEVRGDEVFIFPYQQFLCAHHVHTAVGETLKITLSTHEVTVEGRRMEKLVAALQEFAVAWIRPLPARYQNLRESAGPLITAIDVKALDE
jgi:hypothetical protein